jgi:serine/threonine protein phosphatase 1
VHAGLNPLRDVRSQLNEDIFWIRDEFIQNIHNFGRIVVFGHTPYEDVLVHPPYKIGIDTGLVYGNLLSVVELTKQSVLQIKRGTTEVKLKALGT